jgi:hypothetical protein
MGCIKSKPKHGEGAGGKLTSNDENAVTRRASLMQGIIEHTSEGEHTEVQFHLAEDETRRSKRCYLVQTQWVDAFENYLRFEEAAFPGPISNDELLNGDQRIKPGLTSPQSVRLVDDRIWGLLVSVFSGG